MSEDAALGGVSGAVLGAEEGRTAVDVKGAVERGFGERGCSLGVDDVGSRGGGARDLVGGDADKGAILLVKGIDVQVSFARPRVIAEEKTGVFGEPGTRNIVQWVRLKAVYDDKDDESRQYGPQVRHVVVGECR